MRYERKYRVESIDLASLWQTVKSHPISFRTLFPDRQVNNLYLDTPDMHFFRENLAGVAVRRKYRIRWYGEDISKASNPVMEVKLKDGELGEKLFKKMDDFKIESVSSLGTTIDATIASMRKEAVPQLPVSEDEAWRTTNQGGTIEHDLVQQSRILHPQVKLRPALLNTYLRSYLISSDGRYRLTIDRSMHFHGFNARLQPHRRAVQDDALVMEIKYEAEDDHDFSSTISQRFPFRLGKNSKYVNGLLLVGNV